MGGARAVHEFNRNGIDTAYDIYADLADVFFKAQDVLGEVGGNLQFGRLHEAEYLGGVKAAKGIHHCQIVVAFGDRFKQLPGYFADEGIIVCVEQFEGELTVATPANFNSGQIAKAVYGVYHCQLRIERSGCTRVEAGRTKALL